MDALIYHHPGCSQSRTVLALLRHAGLAPRVVEYLHEPLERTVLRALIGEAGLSVRAALRAKEPAYRARGLDDTGLDEAVLLDAMLAEPVLIQRPLVRTPLGARLCRPPALVLQILPPLATPFVQADGTRIG